MVKYLGHDTPLGAFRHLGSWVQRRGLGASSLSILDLKTFYPRGFPILSPETPDSAPHDADTSTQREGVSEPRSNASDNTTIARKLAPSPLSPQPSSLPNSPNNTVTPPNNFSPTKRPTLPAAPTSGNSPSNQSPNPFRASLQRYFTPDTTGPSKVEKTTTEPLASDQASGVNHHTNPQTPESVDASIPNLQAAPDTDTPTPFTATSAHPANLRPAPSAQGSLHDHHLQRTASPNEQSSSSSDPSDPPNTVASQAQQPGLASTDINQSIQSLRAAAIQRRADPPPPAHPSPTAPAQSEESPGQQPASKPAPPMEVQRALDGPTSLPIAPSAGVSRQNGSAQGEVSQSQRSQKTPQPQPSFSHPGDRPSAISPPDHATTLQRQTTDSITNAHTRQQGSKITPQPAAAVQRVSQQNDSTLEPLSHATHIQRQLDTASDDLATSENQKSNQGHSQTSPILSPSPASSATEVSKPLETKDGGATVEPKPTSLAPNHSAAIQRQLTSAELGDTDHGPPSHQSQAQSHPSNFNVNGKDDTSVLPGAPPQLTSAIQRLANGPEDPGTEPSAPQQSFGQNQQRPTVETSNIPQESAPPGIQRSESLDQSQPPLGQSSPLNYLSPADAIENLGDIEPQQKKLTDSAASIQRQGDGMRSQSPHASPQHSQPIDRQPLAASTIQQIPQSSQSSTAEPSAGPSIQRTIAQGNQVSDLPPELANSPQGTTPTPAPSVARSISDHRPTTPTASPVNPADNAANIQRQPHDTPGQSSRHQNPLSSVPSRATSLSTEPESINRESDQVSGSEPSSPLQSGPLASIQKSPTETGQNDAHTTIQHPSDLSNTNIISAKSEGSSSIELSGDSTQPLATAEATPNPVKTTQPQPKTGPESHTSVPVSVPGGSIQRVVKTAQGETFSQSQPGQSTQQSPDQVSRKPEAGNNHPTILQTPPSSSIQPLSHTSAAEQPVANDPDKPALPTSESPDSSVQRAIEPENAHTIEVGSDPLPLAPFDSQSVTAREQAAAANTNQSIQRTSDAIGKSHPDILDTQASQQLPHTSGEKRSRTDTANQSISSTSEGFRQSIQRAHHPASSHITTDSETPSVIAPPIHPSSENLSPSIQRTSHPDNSHTTADAEAPPTVDFVTSGSTPTAATEQTVNTTQAIQRASDTVEIPQTEVLETQSSQHSSQIAGEKFPLADSSRTPTYPNSESLSPSVQRTSHLDNSHITKNAEAPSIIDHLIHPSAENLSPSIQRAHQPESSHTTTNSEAPPTVNFVASGSTPTTAIEQTENPSIQRVSDAIVKPQTETLEPQSSHQHLPQTPGEQPPPPDSSLISTYPNSESLSPSIQRTSHPDNSHISTDAETPSVIDQSVHLSSENLSPSVQRANQPEHGQTTADAETPLASNLAIPKSTPTAAIEPIDSSNTDKSIQRISDVVVKSQPETLAPETQPIEHLLVEKSLAPSTIQQVQKTQSETESTSSDGHQPSVDVSASLNNNQTSVTPSNTAQPLQTSVNPPTSDLSQISPSAATADSVPRDTLQRQADLPKSTDIKASQPDSGIHSIDQVVPPGQPSSTDSSSTDTVPETLSGAPNTVQRQTDTLESKGLNATTPDTSLQRQANLSASFTQQSTPQSSPSKIRVQQPSNPAPTLSSSLAENLSSQEISRETIQRGQINSSEPLIASDTPSPHDTVSTPNIQKVSDTFSNTSSLDIASPVAAGTQSGTQDTPPPHQPLSTQQNTQPGETSLESTPDDEPQPSRSWAANNQISTTASSTAPIQRDMAASLQTNIRQTEIKQTETIQPIEQQPTLPGAVQPAVETPSDLSPPAPEQIQRVADRPDSTAAPKSDATTGQTTDNIPIETTAEPARSSNHDLSHSSESNQTQQSAAVPNDIQRTVSLVDQTNHRRQSATPEQPVSPSSQSSSSEVEVSSGPEPSLQRRLDIDKQQLDANSQPKATDIDATTPLQRVPNDTGHPPSDQVANSLIDQVNTVDEKGQGLTSDPDISLESVSTVQRSSNGSAEPILPQDHASKSDNGYLPEPLPTATAETTSDAAHIVQCSDDITTDHNDLQGQISATDGKTVHRQKVNRSPDPQHLNTSRLGNDTTENGDQSSQQPPLVKPAKPALDLEAQRSQNPPPNDPAPQEQSYNALGATNTAQRKQDLPPSSTPISSPQGDSEATLQRAFSPSVEAGQPTLEELRSRQHSQPQPQHNSSTVILPSITDPDSPSSRPTADVSPHITDVNTAPIQPKPEPIVPPRPSVSDARQADVANIESDVAPANISIQRSSAKNTPNQSSAPQTLASPTDPDRASGNQQTGPDHRLQRQPQSTPPWHNAPSQPAPSQGITLSQQQPTTAPKTSPSTDRHPPSERLQSIPTISLQRSSDGDKQPKKFAAPLGTAVLRNTLGSFNRGQLPKVLQPLGVLKPLPALSATSSSVMRRVDPRNQSLPPNADSTASTASPNPTPHPNPVQRQAMPSEWSDLESLVTGLINGQQSSPHNEGSSAVEEANEAPHNKAAQVQRKSADSATDTNSKQNPDNIPKDSSKHTNPSKTSNSIPNEWSNLEDLVNNLQGNSPSSSQSSTAHQSAPSPPKPTSSPPTAQAIPSPALETVTVQRTPDATPAPPVIQRCADESATDTAATAENDQDTNHDYSQYLELLVQEVYDLLRQRLSLERERRGPQYPR